MEERDRGSYYNDRCYLGESLRLRDRTGPVSQYSTHTEATPAFLRSLGEFSRQREVWGDYANVRSFSMHSDLSLETLTSPYCSVGPSWSLRGARYAKKLLTSR